MFFIKMYYLCYFHMKYNIKVWFQKIPHLFLLNVKYVKDTIALTIFSYIYLLQKRKYHLIATSMEIKYQLNVFNEYARKRYKVKKKLNKRTK